LFRKEEVGSKSKISLEREERAFSQKKMFLKFQKLRTVQMTKITFLVRFLGIFFSEHFPSIGEFIHFWKKDFVRK